MQMMENTEMVSFPESVQRITAATEAKDGGGGRDLGVKCVREFLPQAAHFLNIHKA